MFFIFLTIFFIGTSSAFSAELPEEFIPQLKSREGSFQKEKLTESVKDLEDQTKSLKEIVKNGKSDTSQSISTFTSEMLSQLSELTALEKSLQSNLNSHGFSPYFNMIRWLDSKKDYLSDVHQTLVDKHSAEKKRETIGLISIFIDTLLAHLSDANDFYNQSSQENLLRSQPSSPYKLDANSYKYYVELWRKSKDPKDRALAIARLLDNINSFDEFITRFLGKQLHTFMPLLTFRDIKTPENFLMQGWKIHVSAKPETAHLVAQVVLPILAKACVPHKILDSETIIRKLQSDETQKGKFITIYPLNDDHAAYIARILELAIVKSKLKKDDFDVPPYDLPLGETGGIFTRYGAYSGHQITVVDSKGTPQLQDGQIMHIPDVRDSGFKPDFVTWALPFDKQTMSPERTIKRKAARSDLITASSSEITPTQSPTSKPRGHTRGETVKTKEKTAHFATVMRETP
jgi:hypothetical protein